MTKLLYWIGVTALIFGASSLQDQAGWCRTPSRSRGSDSSADGSGEVRQPRMYQLVRQKGPVKDVTFEIEFLDPGVEVFSFTFG